MSDRSYLSDIPRGTAMTGFTMTGFLMGAIFGAGLALLLAPATGPETRRRLGETARRLGDAAGDVLNKVREGGEQGTEAEEAKGTRSTREPLAGVRTPRTAGGPTP